MCENINFPPAVLIKPYTGTCDAAGDLRPIVNASLNTEHYPHLIFITNTTMLTAQAALRILSVTDECSGAIFYCCVCQLRTDMSRSNVIGELSLPLKELWRSPFHIWCDQRYTFISCTLRLSQSLILLGSTTDARQNTSPETSCTQYSQWKEWCSQH